MFGHKEDQYVSVYEQITVIHNRRGKKIIILLNESWINEQENDIICVPISEKYYTGQKK